MKLQLCVHVDTREKKENNTFYSSNLLLFDITLRRYDNYRCL